MRYLDPDRLAATPLARDPFEHVIVPGFVRAEALDALAAVYPAIAEPGSFPLESVKGGAAFDALIAELRAPATAAAFGAAFGLDLGSFPTMVTVCSRCQAKDGRIHADTATKIITVLIYLRARLKRGSHSDFGVIQAGYVDPSEPWPNGRDRAQDQGVPY
ncbi:MAG: hypothetical protein FJX36_16000 [Alphaproteobacteria bacterium]|nr:hypothetical protein [Alphaproteobacteria bacterium]